MTDKLKVGLLDMLTLLLPGGLLIFILFKAGPIASLIPTGFQIMEGDQNAWPGVVLFIAASYVAGHFIYLLASNLDDWIYENVRKVFWNDHRLAAYILERKEAMTGIDDRTVINGFKWSCAWLLKNAPALYAEVERVMAESKFFRSLVVVCFLSCILLACFSMWALSLLMLGLSFLSLFRYLTQRQKSIDAAYIYMITALSEKEPFPVNPDREKLFELRSRSVPFLAGRGNKLPYEIRKNKKDLASFKSYSRKVFEVIKICAWPWYKAAICPEGKPAFKTREIRWFMQTEPEAYKDWVLALCGNTVAPEERPDIYYIKKGMGEMSIKDRGQKSIIEIKRKLPFDDMIMLEPNLNARFESWYKWIVPEKDTTSIKNMLEKGAYKTVTVSKKRWSVGVPASEWRAEYTVVNLQGLSAWYSIALELPYNVQLAEGIADLQASGIAGVLKVDGALMMSYPAFLQEQRRK